MQIERVEDLPNNVLDYFLPFSAKVGMVREVVEVMFPQLYGSQLSYFFQEPCQVYVSPDGNNTKPGTAYTMFLAYSEPETSHDLAFQLYQSYYRGELWNSLAFCLRVKVPDVYANADSETLSEHLRSHSTDSEVTMGIGMFPIKEHESKVYHRIHYSWGPELHVRRSHLEILMYYVSEYSRHVQMKWELRRVLDTFDCFPDKHW